MNNIFCQFPITLARRSLDSSILGNLIAGWEYRGQGLGKQMMQEALKISADAGCYKVTFSSNLKRDFLRNSFASHAHQFYESLGFKQHGWSFSYQIASAM